MIIGIISLIVLVISILIGFLAYNRNNFETTLACLPIGLIAVMIAPIAFMIYAVDHLEIESNTYVYIQTVKKNEPRVKSLIEEYLRDDDKIVYWEYEVIRQQVNDLKVHDEKQKLKEIK